MYARVPKRIFYFSVDKIIRLNGFLRDKNDRNFINTFCVERKGAKEGKEREGSVRERERKRKREEDELTYFFYYLSREDEDCSGGMFSSFFCFFG